jgi:hypothetical protein
MAKSPLLEENIPVPATPDYSDDERKYLSNLKNRLELARTQRDQQHDEFDGQTFLQYLESNRKGANTYIEPKKNKEDTNFVSGTIRQKLFAYLAAINNLDLSPDVQALDDKQEDIRELGEAMEDIMWEAGRQDGDDEKKILRQYNLLTEGTVFVEELWESRFSKKKTFKGEMNGKIESKDWRPILKKDFEGATRRILMPENVFLGDIRQYEISRQPYIFTVEIMSYEEAMGTYGKWQRWKDVPRKVTMIASEGKTGVFSPIHFFDSTLKDEVEIVKYQDRWNDEFMIMINGVMMLPVGFPLSGLTPTGDYSIEKQVYEPISPFFSYGKSLVARMKTASAILDEMYRLAVLKTQKSFAPPMANNTGRVLSSRIFAPGKITIGIDPERLKPIDPSGRAVEGGEFSMINMLQQNIDRSSVDPTFAGQTPQGSPTATQILEVQRQAKLMIGLTVFVCALLEEKLAWLRLYNILKNWFEPVDRVKNEYTGDFINRYRSVSREKIIEGEGSGRVQTKLVDELPAPEEILEQEKVLSKPSKPVRMIFLSPDDIKQSKYTWYIVVAPKEKKTDALSKVMFNEMMQIAMGLPNVNIQYIEERFAEHWGENPAKLFNLQAPAEPQLPGQEQQGSALGRPELPSRPPQATAAQAGGGL